MSAVAFSVRRRDLIWTVALAVLLSTIWIARSDIADAGGSPPGEGIAIVYVAAGTGFADALGVGPGAGANAAPIIIVPITTPIPAPTSAELTRLDPRTVIIVGGLGVVSQAMEDAIAALLPNAAVSRVSGADRYATNAALSAATFPIEGWVSLSAAAFAGDTPATETVFSDPGGAFNGSDGTVWASIQLPHGAEILELETNVFDSDVSDDIGAYLVRATNTGSYTIFMSAANSGSTAGAQAIFSSAITSGFEIVDNGSYTYAVLVNVADGNPRVINVRVRYRLGASSG